MSLGSFVLYGNYVSMICRRTCYASLMQVHWVKSNQYTLQHYSLRYEKSVVFKNWMNADEIQNWILCMASIIHVDNIRSP